MLKKFTFLVFFILLLLLMLSWMVGTAQFTAEPEITVPVLEAREIERVEVDALKVEPLKVDPLKVEPLKVEPSIATSADSLILFGDLHTHTSFSIDAAIIDTPASKGTPRTTPVDACDYARFCSGLDFWSINDHAEGLTPRQWKATRQAVRQCNSAADPGNPDLVSFLGWEWTQGGETPATHYGHKNVIFLDQEEGSVPLRPIGSGEQSIWRWLGRLPAVVRGLGLLAGSRFQPSEYMALAQHMQAMNATPPCAAANVRELGEDCHESAETPKQLFSKLDEWGFEAMVIPHGLSWSTTNPIGADFKYQMDQLNSRYQNLIEVYSGHGNSEVYKDIPVVMPNSDHCPAPVEGFTPCCWQAGAIIQQRCETNGGIDCAGRADKTRKSYLHAMTTTTGASPHRTVVPDTVPDDWGQCDQLVDSFQPAHNYQARQAAQYILSLNDNGTRFKPGFIASSDNHAARPGNGFKETSRYFITDTKAQPSSQTDAPIDTGFAADQPQKPAAFIFEDSVDAANGFFFSGGLVAVHSEGRDRQAIWTALKNKRVYGTSGPRIKLWFDAVDGEGRRFGMGSELSIDSSPRFTVSAVGSLKQRAGCPQQVIDSLGRARTDSLCRSECFFPGEEVHKIDRIEVVRIIPGSDSARSAQERIQDPWRVFGCGNDTQCSVEFSDEDLLPAETEAIYYARAIQEATDTIQGDPFHCDKNEQGQCVKTNYCIGVAIEDDCIAPAQHRAWSSPIYISYQTDPAGGKLH